MDIEKLIEQLRKSADFEDYPIVASFAAIIEKKYLRDAATALSALQAENEKLRAESIMHHNAADNYFAELTEYRQERNEALAELEQVKRLYESEKEDFLDYACSGIPNFAPYCFNRHPDCVDERGWCKSAECHGFSRNRGQKED